MRVLQLIEETMRRDINFEFWVDENNKDFILDLLILIGEVPVGFTATVEESDEYTTISYSSMSSLWENINGKTKVLAMCMYVYMQIDTLEDEREKLRYKTIVDEFAKVFRNSPKYSNGIAGYGR